MRDAEVTVLVRCSRHGWGKGDADCHGCVQRDGVRNFAAKWFVTLLFLSPVIVAALMHFGLITY